MSLPSKPWRRGSGFFGPHRFSSMAAPPPPTSPGAPLQDAPLPALSFPASVPVFLHLMPQVSSIFLPAALWLCAVKRNSKLFVFQTRGWDRIYSTPHSTSHQSTRMWEAKHREECCHQNIWCMGGGVRPLEPQWSQPESSDPNCIVSQPRGSSIRHLHPPIPALVWFPVPVSC